MGLPIWRDPDEKPSASRQDASKADSSARARSTIRRQPPIHGRRVPRTHSSSRAVGLTEMHLDRSISALFDGVNRSRRSDTRDVPTVTTLLESARAPVPLPPPAPEASSFMGRGPLGAQRERLQRIRQAAAARQYYESQQASHARRIGDRIREQRARLPPPASSLSDGPEQHTIITRSRRNRRPGSRDNPPGRRRPDSRDGDITRRSPHPLSTESPPPEDGHFSLHLIDGRRPVVRTHPLSNSWGPNSPVNGLGDRDRSPSPTPVDRWDIMRSTIAPDETLPSAESSATSTAASQSFGSTSSGSGTDTHITDPEADSSTDSRGTPIPRNGSESASTYDPDDLACMEEDLTNNEMFAEEMYLRERSYPEGRRRIEAHQRAHEQDGNRFALAAEPARIDIGFRLIEEALETEEGRERVWQTLHNGPEDLRHLEEAVVSASRRNGEREAARQGLRRAPPLTSMYSGSSLSGTHTPIPSEPWPSNAPGTPRFTAQTPFSTAYTAYRNRRDALLEQAQAQASINIVTSRDAPEAYPVSPPSTGFYRPHSPQADGELLARNAVSSYDDFLSESNSNNTGFHVSELDSVRRIVERLASRDDVPQEWWMSMGLNLSRTRQEVNRPATENLVPSPPPSASPHESPSRPQSTPSRGPMGLVPATETRIPSPVHRY